MGYFPFFVDIRGKNGLIAGGGKVAFHKLKKLLPYGARLKIVAPEISEELENFVLERTELENSQIKKIELKNTQLTSDIRIIKKEFESSDLKDVNFAIAASDDKVVNQEIAKLCWEKNILVNVVDDKEACSFLFPSLVKSGRLCIGITTEGASPEIAAAVRSQIVSSIPANMDEILEYLSSLRPLAKETIQDDCRRAAFLKDMARACMDRNAIFGEQETLKRLDAYAGNEYECDNGGVLLVGAGCGAYDLITLKGLRAIRRANVLVYDDLIDPRLLEHASESCELIYVGKRSGRHSMRQEEINDLLAAKARKGGLVVRLKGGDPFVFGRGMEELAALKKAGIDADYIPGITSCIAVPAMADIPVTHRETSRSFHVITGHTATGDEELAKDIDFQTIAKLEGTLIFLMGFSHLGQIAGELIRAGKEEATPVAVVHGNFDETVDVVKGTLINIAERVAKTSIQTPAVIVIGEVVNII